ncbi:uncharacterized protein KIAA0825-like isoform X1 [Acipenser ruthenus]|uniref:uncharacterized protein KIAA0825-like isoform X1 n=1 Tax=Acipenser ruthenus TaxID=7906 RepID=UPI002741E4FB|nr:uncharacterized protein KIAA0825-like isoform X1 [Acipenser ruthenus]XP_058843430.1 uncharacterized protein KIAA0825-like isoform X1 [Acipenser ruthenus]XP_058843434.1 uncharacterized protein KIAA0825-like isoform X1 [Acipenser ruthenus]
MEWQGEYLQDHSFLDCLLSGVPGNLELQQVLDDTEEKLKLNALCIEQRLKELQVELNDTWTGEKLPCTTDNPQWFSPSNFSSLKPSCTGHQDLLDFLKALQHFLKTEQGQEETLLLLLLDISSQCGVSFPSPPSGSSFQLTSRTSLHAVGDDFSIDVQSVWDDVRLHLRRFLVDKLQCSQEVGHQLHHRVAFKTQCLQQLLFLYPESEVLSKYQSIQSKAVQDLLQNSVLSSPGETNFDKLVQAHQRGIPSICSMIKEDLQMLNGIMEPSMTLKFLNETYLSNITDELSTLIEKICDLQFKENVMHATKMDKSKQKGAVHAMALQERPKKGRNFCLTSHQLRCLAQLMKSLLCMEERILELATEVSFLNCGGEAASSIQGMLKKTCEDTDMTPAETSKQTAEQLLQVTEPAVLEFDWRCAFKDLAPAVAHCVKVVLEDICVKRLQQEENFHSSDSSRVMDLCSLQQDDQICLPSRTEEPPQRIAKFCADIMEELDMLLPLALACRKDFLQEIIENFVEVCSKVTAAVLTRLEERSKEVPLKSPIQNLHTLLSTAIHVLQRLTQYEARLKDASCKPLFPLSVQRYQELISALQDQVTSYCVTVCTTSILQDPESHHWGDPKVFYEGERCSFSIQMWHYYLSALRHDLWSVLPPSLAQEILAQVLSQTLEMLVQRYSQARPTYRRTLQIRTDITAILLCTENLIWSLCSTREELLHPSRDICPWIFSIHSHCNHLLTALAIVTSPLHSLFETFQKGPGDLSSLSTSENSSYHLLQWLRFIKSSLFSQESLGTLSADEIASQCHLKLMLSQPSCNLSLLLQTLLHNRCLILKVLLKISNYETDEKGLSMEAVFMVLTSLNILPKSLCFVLESYLDEQQLWDHLYNLPDSSKPETEVLKCLRLAVTKPIMSAVNQIMSMVYAWQAAEHHGTCQHRQMAPESLLNKIPKDWNYVPRELKRKESGKSFTKLVAQAVSFIFTNLPTMIASLPVAVKYLFYIGEKKLSRNTVPLKQTGLLIWTFTSYLCRTLDDGNAIELLTGVALDRWSKETLGLLSECLQNIVGQQKGIPKPVVQKIIQNMEVQRPQWIKGQLQKARKLCTKGAFEPAESTVVQEKGIASELTEQKIGMMVLDICHKPGGSEYLRQIYHIIQLNEEYLKTEISTVKDSAAEPHQRPLKLNHKDSEQQQQPSVFSPLKEFCCIGSNKFDQSAITEWDWDWSKLLPGYLGLSQVTLRALLANRWEMQEAAALEDEEKTLVDHLQETYFDKSQGT